MLSEGETWDLASGGSLTFVETTEWATLQVTQDPGNLVAFAASTGMVVGLCLSLFVRRRRVWVRVEQDAASEGPRTVVEVAGLARTAPDAFEAEFAELVGRLRGSSPDAVPAPTDPKPTPIRQESP